MKVNSWNAYNNSGVGAIQSYLPTVGANNARATGANQSPEQKTNSYLPDWDKVKEAVVARLPQAQEFARRAFAGAVGAGVSMISGTVLSMATGRPTMSGGQIAGYAVASGIVSACTANVPSAAFVHGIGIGIVAQFAFSHATNNARIEGQKALTEEKGQSSQALSGWKAENDRLSAENQQFKSCQRGYEQVAADGKLDECEKLGYTYATLEEQCKQGGFVKPTRLMFC